MDPQLIKYQLQCKSILELDELENEYLLLKNYIYSCNTNTNIILQLNLKRDEARTSDFFEDVYERIFNYSKTNKTESECLNEIKKIIEYEYRIYKFAMQIIF